jgi:hypothetical protein
MTYTPPRRSAHSASPNTSGSRTAGSPRSP